MGLGRIMALISATVRIRVRNLRQPKEDIRKGSIRVNGELDWLLVRISKGHLDASDWKKQRVTYTCVWTLRFGAG